MSVSPAKKIEAIVSRIEGQLEGLAIADPPDVAFEQQLERFVHREMVENNPDTIVCVFH